MSFHTDYDGWLRMSDPRYCPCCNDEPMPDGQIDVVELEHSWLNARPVDCLYGACHLTAKKHALELYDLPDTELLGLMKEVALCARAIQNVTRAVKINYEIHGNSTPHLHVHLYPRYMDDPFPGKAIDYSLQVDQYAAGGFQTFVEALRSEIRRLS